jgi:hypothetical protein
MALSPQAMPLIIVSPLPVKDDIPDSITKYKNLNLKCRQSPTDKLFLSDLVEQSGNIMDISLGNFHDDHVCLLLADPGKIPD